MRCLRHVPVVLLMVSVLAPVAAFTQPASDTWIQLQPAVSPPTRHGHWLAYDAARRNIVLFGGNSVSQMALMNDTWVWNGVTWKEKHPLQSPAPRATYSIAYDAARHCVVLFGGYSTTTGDFNDTWLWDGENWTEALPAHRPPIRSQHAMAYDPVRQRIVLFSGQGPAYTNYTDTWAWDGSDWIELTPLQFPPPRANHVMAWDPGAGHIVMWGGASWTAYFNDTWTWDGTSWTQMEPADSPATLMNSTMDFHALLGRMILFGGRLGWYDVKDDTWIWDGANWAIQPMPVKPPARFFGGMAYDAARRQMVLFGGITAFGDEFGDTWVMGPPFVDDTPPEFKSLTASPAVLWPPNHKMTPVVVSAVLSDEVDPNPTARVVDVSLDQKPNGAGDGNTSTDYQITGDLSVSLRAERSGVGVDRVYTIVVRATDESGNHADRSVTVVVPHN